MCRCHVNRTHSAIPLVNPDSNESAPHQKKQLHFQFIRFSRDCRHLQSHGHTGQIRPCLVLRVSEQLSHAAPDPVSWITHFVMPMKSAIEAPRSLPSMATQNAKGLRRSPITKRKYSWNCARTVRRQFRNFHAIVFILLAALLHEVRDEGTLVQFSQERRS
jgi:hypothetical protein